MLQLHFVPPSANESNVTMGVRTRHSLKNYNGRHLWQLSPLNQTILNFKIIREGRRMQSLKNLTSSKSYKRDA